MSWDKAIWTADEAVEGVGQMLQAASVNVNIPVVTGVKYVFVPYNNPLTYIGSGVAIILNSNGGGIDIEIDDNEKVTNLRPPSNELYLFFGKRIKIYQIYDAPSIPVLILFTNRGGYSVRRPWFQGRNIPGRRCAA